METKICTKCKIDKTLDEFYDKKDKYKDKIYTGKRTICIICISKKRKERYKNNREKELKKNLEWAIANKEKHSIYLRAYFQEHKKEHCERTKKWYRENPQYCRNRQALKRALIKQRLPKFADKEKIREVYNKALEMTKETGQLYHVDHIVPLRGENVSGLHVHYNLQVLLATENLLKSNKFNV